VPSRVAQPPAANRGTVGSRTAGGRQILRNPAFAAPTSRDPATRALARATFQGRFADQRVRLVDRSGRMGQPHGRVLGWVGPLFWPYAYQDFIDYTFWPYAYDTFWPSAYDDVYEGILGPYAYVEGGTANPPPRRGRVWSNAPVEATAQICAEQSSELTDWPIEQIKQLVAPDAAQSAALAELQAATAEAVELLRSACPIELPSTPTGRIAAMRQRLETRRCRLFAPRWRSSTAR